MVAPGFTIGLESALMRYTMPSELPVQTVNDVLLVSYGHDFVVHASTTFLCDPS